MQSYLSKHRTQCWNLHAEIICKAFLKEGNCFEKDCSSKHPYHCRYFRRGCKRGNECVYLHHKDNDSLIKNEIVLIRMLTKIIITRRVSSMSNSNLYCKLKDAEWRMKSVGLRVKNEVWGSGGGWYHKFVKE